MKTRYFLFALVAMFLTGCAGMTAAETTGVIVAGTGVLTALADAIVPYLPPEKQVEVVEAMNSAQGLMNAVTTAMGSVAEAAANAQQAAQESGMSAAEEAGLVAAGAGGGAGLVRLMRGKPETARQAERARGSDFQPT